MMLALSYGIAYLVGSILSASLLAFAVGNVFDWEMFVFFARLIVACALAAFVIMGFAHGLDTVGIEPARAVGGADHDRGAPGSPAPSRTSSRLAPSAWTS